MGRLWPSCAIACLEAPRPWRWSSSGGRRSSRGAFLLAAQWEVPVVALSVVRERGSRYRGFVSQLPAPPQGNIRSRSQFFAREYAAFLEDVLRQYPEQWFNFYDFWE